MSATVPSKIVNVIGTAVGQDGSRWTVEFPGSLRIDEVRSDDTYFETWKFLPSRLEAGITAQANRSGELIRFREHTSEPTPMFDTVVEGRQYWGPVSCPTCRMSGTVPCVRGSYPSAVWMRQTPYPRGHDSRRTANRQHAERIANS